MREGSENLSGDTEHSRPHPPTILSPGETRPRSRRYRHKRSKSHDNYAKFISPKQSPRVERLHDSYPFKSPLMTTIETQTDESSLMESSNGSSVLVTRQLHLNLPSSPTINHSEENKVTDMSLGSDGSSLKTPGGFDVLYNGKYYGNGSSKSFSTPTLEEEDGRVGCPSPTQQIKRSVSSTLDEEEDGDEEEEDDDFCGDDADGIHKLGRDNNNRYHNESSDDMLDHLDLAVTQLCEGKNGNGRISMGETRCRCHCKCGAGVVTVNTDTTDNQSVLKKGRELRHSTGMSGAESNETIDSRDTTDSREDIYEDGFETFSDDDQNARNYEFLKRRS